MKRGIAGFTIAFACVAALLVMSTEAMASQGLAIRSARDSSVAALRAQDLAASAQSAAADGSGIIRGTVLDYAGLPPAKAYVMWLAGDWSQVRHWKHSADFAWERVRQARDKGWFPDDPKLANGSGDAFRHATWNLVLSQRIGVGDCKIWTDAHESGHETTRASRMDLHNNQVGRQLYSKLTSVITSHETAESWWTSEQIHKDTRLWWFGHGV